MFAYANILDCPNAVYSTVLIRVNNERFVPLTYVVLKSRFRLIVRLSKILRNNPFQEKLLEITESEPGSRINAA